jgi:chorismate mutase
MALEEDLIALTDMGRLRDVIDEQDQNILALLESRRATSLRLQRLKVRAGLPSVDLSREKRVRIHYADRHGAKGVAVADSVLALCRVPFTTTEET